MISKVFFLVKLIHNQAIKVKFYISTKNYNYLGIMEMLLERNIYQVLLLFLLLVFRRLLPFNT